MVRKGGVGSTEQGPACTLGEGQQERLCAAWLAEGMAPLGHLVPPSCRPSEVLWVPSQGLSARGRPVLWSGVVPQFLSFSSLGGFILGALTVLPCP